jgi:hypothetical protein
MTKLRLTMSRSLIAKQVLRRASFTGEPPNQKSSPTAAMPSLSLRFPRQTCSRDKPIREVPKRRGLGVRKRTAIRLASRPGGVLHVLLGGVAQPLAFIRENNEMVETFIRPIEKAPTNTNLCLFGQDSFGLYQIPFACRLEAGRWINAQLRHAIKITPVGWKPWGERDRRIGRSKDQLTFPFNFGLRPCYKSEALSLDDALAEKFSGGPPV